MNETSELLKSLAAYVESHGTIERACPLGHIGVRCHVIKTEHVQVAKAVGSQMMEICLLANDNPAVMVTEEGKTIRFHGEMWEHIPHVKALIGMP